MFELKTGYFISGLITGLVLLFSFIQTLPDGKMHIYFCDVGQGDGAYIQFPNGSDMVVDGGPSEKSMLSCLGQFMPFWDRHIDMVVMSHPQKDHLQGLLGVLDRYQVSYFVQSNAHSTTEGYEKLVSLVAQKNVLTKRIGAGSRIDVGGAVIQVLWPDSGETNQQVNDASLVFWVTYGATNILFTGDADTRVSTRYVGSALPDTRIELLKVPHHGSKTGMNASFLEWLRPTYAIISVGKNNYGHPTQEIIDLIKGYGITLLRTDQSGDVQFASDGITLSRY